jgi:hypothetical protein
LLLQNIKGDIMTREEAKKKLLATCKLITHYSWSDDRQKQDVPHYHLSDIKTIKLIDQIYDSFDEREKLLAMQDICSQECKYYFNDNGIYPCIECSRHYVDYFEKNKFKRIENVESD